MRIWLPLAVSVVMLGLAGESPPAAAQAGNAIERSQTERTIDAIQNQMRQAVRPKLAARTPAGAIESLALGRGGRLLAIAREDNTIRLFDLEAGVERLRLAGSASRIGTLAVTRDDRFVLSGGEDGTLAVWDGATGARVRGIVGPDGALGALASAPDGRAVATGAADGTVRLLALDTGRVLGVMRGHAGAVTSLAMSPDGRTLLSGGADGRAILWNLGDGRALATLGGHAGQVVAVGFDKAGRSVTADEAGTVRVWSRNPAKLVRSFGDARQASGAAITPDGRFIVMGAAEGRARLYDIDSGRRVREFNAPAGSLRHLLVDANRQRLLAGGDDGTVRLWNLGDGASLAEIGTTAP